MEDTHRLIQSQKAYSEKIDFYFFSERIRIITISHGYQNYNFRRFNELKYQKKTKKKTLEIEEP